MDERSSDPDNPAKRRCLNDRNSDHSDSLFVSQSPEPTIAKYSSSIEDALDDDNDDESESDGDEPKYKECEESPPACLAFDPKVDDSMAKANEVVTALISAMEQRASGNKDLENMTVKAAEVMRSELRKLKVAMLGGTGVGKSALINCLIGCLGLAKELSGGEACTSVPMIYVHELAGQTASLAAKVTYYSVKDCRKVLKWLLDSYNRCKFNFDKDWTDEMKKKYLQEANTAFDTLRTLFCDRKGFKTRQSAINTIARSHNKAGRSNLLSTMTGWYEESLREKSHEDGMSFTFCQSNTVGGLRAALDPLITPKFGYSVPSLWPFVKELTIGVPSSRILQYLTLVDLPGLSDTNKMRVRATLEHLNKCEAMWYVVPVDRVLTDPDLDYAVSNYSERFRDTLAVVVTKVDKDVTDALAEDMRRQGQNLGNYDEWKKSIIKRTAQPKSVRSKLKNRSLSVIQKNRLRDQEEELETDLTDRKSKISRCITNARNAHVVAGLKCDKAQHLPKGTILPVYCVSNRHYATHKGSTDPIEGPLLDVESTGIPALRSYAISLAAPAVWDNTKEILIHRLKILFHGVHGWAQTSPMERDKGLADVFKPAKSLWKDLNNASADRCIQDFSSPIIAKLLAGHSSSVDDMRRRFDHIRNQWNHLTFLAFFRNEGTHSTRAVGAHSWNEDFLKWQKINVFKPAWDASPDPVDFFDDGVEELIKVLEDITERLNSKPESVPLSMTSFANALPSQVASIRTARDTAKREFRVVYGNIRLHACLDQPEGYFTKVMKSCYYKGKHYKGEGVCERVKDLLSNHLTQEKDPLTQANDMLEKALESAARKQASSLSIEVMKILDKIDVEFEGVWKKDSETPKEAEARSKIGEVLHELMPEIARIENDLMAIEAEYQCDSGTSVLVCQRSVLA